jgi:3-dehydroquinate synthase
MWFKIPVKDKNNYFCGEQNRTFMESLHTQSAKVALSSHPVNDLQQLIEELSPDKVFLLTDENTQRHCLPRIGALDALSDERIIVIPSGDDHKGLESLSLVWTSLSDEGAGRHSLLINLGGGMPCDLGGFAAASYKRGISFINMPTTLLSMVDASVGGKTGINFNGYKNEIGVFRLAEKVLIHTPFLESLDRTNLLSGYAEMLKHALIDNIDTLNGLLAMDVMDLNADQLGAMVAKSVLVKDRYVFADPLENGLRKALNLGHTIGHAFESMAMKQQSPILHGYAVAFGLIPELALAVKKCGFPQSIFTDVVAYINKIYGTHMFTQDDFETLYALMCHDKKNRGQRINFTLLSDVGQPVIDVDCSREEIQESLLNYLES